MTIPKPVLLSLIFIIAVGAHPFRLSESVFRQNGDEANYRISTTQVPSGYVISLAVPDTVFTGESTQFTGTTEVSFSITNETDTVCIHAPGPISTSAIQIFQPGVPSTTISVSGSSFNATTEILDITFNQMLTSFVTYTLKMNFTAQLETKEMIGFYRSSYFDENNSTQYLVTTQFQPTHARKAFPCFDEPRFKATFQLIITHPLGTAALANADILEEVSEGSMTKTTFVASPRMSSYLVAFVVSKFTCSEGLPIATNVPHYVCSTPDSQHERDLANQYSAEIMQTLERFTGIAFTQSGLNKVHQVAVPDFSAGAMENWGLVTYREMALLYDENNSSNVNKQTILTTIAHEFAHMWFGNLVTCDWWNSTFLNEGFATYFEYFIPANITSLESGENWQMARQFVIDIVQEALAFDGSNSSNALTSSAVTPSEISGKFNTISYSKGASVFRMIENFMGNWNFLRGIRSYLSTRQYMTAEPEDLWNALQAFTSADSLPRSHTLNEVMNSWVNYPGYPLVTVDDRGNDVLLSQKKFLYRGNGSDTWFVPISYTLSNDTSQFSNFDPKLWLIPQHIHILPGILVNNSWIIVNNQQSGYYRVTYSESLWNKIIDELYTNHTSIDVLNRAQIVDDALNLARAGEISYELAFRVLEYLRNETEYYPWYSAITGLSYFYRLLGESSEAGIQLQNFEKDIIQNVKNSISFTLDSSNQIDTLRDRLILARACRLNDPSCVENATALYRKYTAGISVDRNLRTLVYCNGLRYSSNISDWDYLWHQLHTTGIASEQVTILSALGCYRNRTTSEYYLEQSINESSIIRHQDVSRIWSAVVGSSDEGVNTALSYYIDNWQKISEYDASALSLLSTVTARLTTQSQLSKLKEFANSANLTESLKNMARSAVNSVEANLKLATDTKEQMSIISIVDGANFAIPSSLVIVSLAFALLLM